MEVFVLAGGLNKEHAYNLFCLISTLNLSMTGYQMCCISFQEKPMHIGHITL